MLLQDLEIAPSVEFRSSRCFDVIAACHLLIDPSHHAYASKWAEDVRSKISASALDALRTLSTLPAQCLELAGLCCVVDDLDDVESLVRATSGTSPEEFVFWALGRRVPLGRISDHVRGKRSLAPFLLAPGRQEPALLNGLLKEPCRYRDAASTAWSAISPYVIEKSQSLHGREREWQHALRLKYMGIRKDVLALALELGLGDSGSDNGAGAWYFIVSWFLSPHRLRWADLQRCFVAPDWQEVSGESERERAEHLGKVVGALADTNRLIILRELARSRCSGRMLAPRLGVTPATMSHHLDVLVSAGLVTRESAGNGQVYSLDLAAIDAAVTEVRSYLSYGTKEA